MSTELERSIGCALADPPAVEALYRGAKAGGDVEAFKDAVQALLAGKPDNVLLLAWAARLDIVVEAEPAEEARAPIARRRWFVAVPVSVLVGSVFVLLTRGQKPLVPIMSASFLLAWGPVVAAAILIFCLVVRPDHRRLKLGAIALVALAVLFGLAAWKGWQPLAQLLSDSGPGPVAGSAQATLIAIHLPFACWAILAGALCLRLADFWRQLYAFVVKSAETIVTAGVYLIAGVVFSALTFGVFGVLGIHIPEELLSRFAAWGLGVVPVLAVATVFDPSHDPADQRWDTGLARVIRILVRLLLPLTLGVLAVYVLYSIPMHFLQAFKERETLIVYNISIIAIIAVLAVAAPGLDEKLLAVQSKILRYAIVAAAILTLLLNCYAFAAIVWRTIEGGYSANRHAVIGWNVVTILMLSGVLLRQALARGRAWDEIFRRSVAQVLVLAAGWATWVVVVLPHF